MVIRWFEGGRGGNLMWITTCWPYSFPDGKNMFGLISSPLPSACRSLKAHVNSSVKLQWWKTVTCSSGAGFNGARILRHFISRYIYIYIYMKMQACRNSKGSYDSCHRFGKVTTGVAESKRYWISPLLFNGYPATCNSLQREAALSGCDNGNSIFKCKLFFYLQNITVI